MSDLFEFPAHTIFCNPKDEQYFKDRIIGEVSVLPCRWIQENHYVRSKDLYIKYTEPKIGYDTYDFENNKFTLSIEIESIHAI